MDRLTVRKTGRRGENRRDNLKHEDTPPGITEPRRRESPRNGARQLNHSDFGLRLITENQKVTTAPAMNAGDLIGNDAEIGKRRLIGGNNVDFHTAPREPTRATARFALATVSRAARRAGRRSRFALGENASASRSAANRAANSGASSSSRRR